MSDTARILKPGGSGRFVTEDHETAVYLVDAAQRSGLVPTLTESTAGVAAPGASGFGVPRFSGETRVWVVEVAKP
jgi:hypothetical protein